MSLVSSLSAVSFAATFKAAAAAGVKTSCISTALSMCYCAIRIAVRMSVIDRGFTSPLISCLTEISL
eukprot:2853876-Rhodomonas_salina.1